MGDNQKDFILNNLYNHIRHRQGKVHVEWIMILYIGTKVTCEGLHNQNEEVREERVRGNLQGGYEKTTTHTMTHL